MELKIGLYETPGQSGDFKAQIICQGALVVIMMVDHGCKVPLETGLSWHIGTIPEVLRLVLHNDENRNITASILSGIV